MTFEEVRTFLNTSFGGVIAPCFDCHKVEGDKPYVFANDETLYDTLTTSIIETCEDRVLVSPGDAENSALYLVLLGESCGAGPDAAGKMPFGCTENEFENSCSPLEDRERLRLWIEAGAPQ
jgi:hypothetical protein